MTGIFERLQLEIETLERVERKSLAELQELPHELAHLVHVIWRRVETSLPEIVHELDMEPSEVKGVLDRLVEQGHLEVREVEGELCYRASPALKHAREAPFNIWEVLGDKLG